MASTTEAGRFACHKCNRAYRWKPELAGRKVKCTCGEVMRAPAHPPAASPKPPPQDDLIPFADSSPSGGEPARPARRHDAGEHDAAHTVHGHQILASTGFGTPAIDEPPAAKPTPSPQPRGAPRTPYCPACNAQLAEGALLCVNCGLSLQSGQKVHADPHAGAHSASAAHAGGVVRVPSLAMQHRHGPVAAPATSKAKVIFMIAFVVAALGIAAYSIFRMM